MPGRGPQTFKKRQKEQERKERQQEKMAKRLQRKAERAAGSGHSDEQDSVIPPNEDDNSGPEILASSSDLGKGQFN